MTGNVKYSVSGGIAEVALNRAEKLNAFNPDMLAEVRRKFAEAVRNENVRVVTLTGTGRAFSSGQDVSAFPPPGADGYPDLGKVLDREYAPLVLDILNCPKVTIAALNGPAVGAAANIALCCDIVVAAHSAYLQQAFVRIGLIPDVGGTWLLPRIAGMKMALALALTGDRVSADEAKNMGLVYRVFPDTDFAAQSHTFIETFVKGPAIAYRLIKEAFRKSLDNSIEAQLKLETELQRKAGKTDDFLEAIGAFATKRAPVFGASRAPA